MVNYFKPRKIELYRNRTIYELVGIRIFKKYLPTSGDLVRKWSNIVQIKSSESGRINELYRIEQKTRTYEIRHIFGAVGFMAIVLITDKELTVLDVCFLVVLNLCVNIYPIFLQRYNRIRIIRILQNNGFGSPYDV
ncbi:MAG: hypothetical protein ACOYOA_11480 [Saprospiraceae bacterium]